MEIINNEYSVYRELKAWYTPKPARVKLVRDAIAIINKIDQPIKGFSIRIFFACMINKAINSKPRKIERIFSFPVDPIKAKVY